MSSNQNQKRSSLNFKRFVFQSWIKTNLILIKDRGLKRICLYKRVPSPYPIAATDMITIARVEIVVPLPLLAIIHLIKLSFPIFMTKRYPRLLQIFQMN